jgi:hypothetical protein
VNTLNQMYQLQKWQEMRENTLVELDRIDKELDLICEESGCERYKDILVMWYVGRRWTRKKLQRLLAIVKSRENLYIRLRQPLLESFLYRFSESSH